MVHVLPVYITKIKIKIKNDARFSVWLKWKAALHLGNDHMTNTFSICLHRKYSVALLKEWQQLDVDLDDLGQFNIKAFTLN